MATEKTSNDYREERKARLAKAAKKNATKSHKVSVSTLSTSAKRTIAIVVAVVIAAAIALGACASSGVFERMKKIETVSGDTYSAVEYQYYYRYMHEYIYSSAQQYDSYYGAGAGLQYIGYDCTKLPEDQKYTGSDYKLEDGSTPTWQQYFEYAALSRMQQYQIMVDLANADESFEIDPAALEEAKTQIEDMKAQLKEQAEAQGGTAISFSKFLRRSYGKGMNLKTFEKIVETQTIASEYSSYLLETKAEAYAADTAKLEEIYNKDVSAYDSVDYRLFTIAPETVTHDKDATTEEKNAANQQAKEAAKKKAEEMLAKIKDDKSFIVLAEKYATKEQKEALDYSKSESTLRTFVSKSTNPDGLTEEVTKWLFNRENKVGDKKVFDVNGTQVIIYIVKPAYRDDATYPADVRHILVQFAEDAKDAEADKKAKKAEAEKILAQIQSADDPLKKFLELCGTESDDTGSVADGGLYEFVTRGQMVKPFEDWTLSADRKEGDLAIVETDYGYHIMYFVKRYNYPTWKYTISDSIANEELNTMLDDALETDRYKVADDNKMIAKLNEKSYDAILSTYYPNVEKVELTTAA